MDPVAFKYLAASLTVVGMCGAAIGVSNIITAALNGISRNPGSVDKMSTFIYVGAALVEAMGLFSLLVGFLVLFA